MAAAPAQPEAACRAATAGGSCAAASCGTVPTTYASGQPGETLAYFTHRLLDFREAELLAALDQLHLARSSTHSLKCLPGDTVYAPLRVLPAMGDAAARDVAGQAVLLKGIFELWATGETLDSLRKNLSTCPQYITQRWMQPSVKFKVVVDQFGGRMAEAHNVDLMEPLLSVLKPQTMQGKVDLKAPDVKLWLIIVDTADRAYGMPQLPLRYVFAREIAQGAGTARAQLARYALPQRRYLGPTSMDAELSFLMATLGRVHKGSLVYDPFAGTGSILVGAAARGAVVVGADIDIRAIRDGKVDAAGGAVTVYSNFKDYGLPSPAGLLRGDAAHPPWRRNAQEVFDAMLCDPPYGVRAGGRCMLPRPPGAPAAPKSEDYIPATFPYPFGACLRDLLDTAARMLTVGGRLVFWLPDFNGAPPGSADDAPPHHNNDDALQNGNSALPGAGVGAAGLRSDGNSSLLAAEAARHAAHSANSIAEDNADVQARQQTHVSAQQAAEAHTQCHVCATRQAQQQQTNGLQTTSVCVCKDPRRVLSSEASVGAKHNHDASDPDAVHARRQQSVVEAASSPPEHPRAADDAQPDPNDESTVGSIRRHPEALAGGSSLPEHPCLRVLNNCVQVLTARYVRRLVTMEKAAPYESGGGAAWAAAHAALELPVDTLAESVYATKTTRQERSAKKQRFRGKLL